jgi:hypothetical protein
MSIGKSKKLKYFFAYFSASGNGCAIAGSDIYLSGKNIHIFGKYGHIAGKISDILLIFVGMQVDILCDRFYTYIKSQSAHYTEEFSKC